MLYTIFIGLGIYGLINLLSCRCRCTEQPVRTEDHLDKMHRWATEREAKRLADLKRWKPPYVLSERIRRDRAAERDPRIVMIKRGRIEPTFS
jgi:hypothetical protein